MTETKEAIVEELAEELKDRLSEHFWQWYYCDVRCDRGCWEVLIRECGTHNKAFQCTLAEEDINDIWVYFNEDYNNCTKFELCDPDWIDKMLDLVVAKLG